MRSTRLHTAIGRPIQEPHGGLPWRARLCQGGGVGELNLLHPWLLTGLAGASLPVLIHLIGRKRAPTVFFAAFDFLMAVNKRLARRERLRQLLLLLLRTAAIAALVSAA